MINRQYVLPITISVWLLLFVGPSIGLAQSDDYVLLVPTHTTSGTYAGDYDLAGINFKGDGYVTWGKGKPKSISSLQVREYSPSAIPDGQKGLFLSYTVEHTDSSNNGDRDIVLRRIDASGNDLWNDEEVGPAILLAQSEHLEENARLSPATNGMYVVYEVRYRTGKFSGDVDIAAIRVDSNGKPVWESAIWVANQQTTERIRSVYPDGYGNVIVVFERNLNAQGQTPNFDILASKIDPDGNLGWGGSNGAVVGIAQSGFSEENSSVVPDGHGGCYIAYELHYTSGDRRGDVDIIAQHLTSSGQRLWTNTQSPPVVSSSRTVREISPSVSVDSAGVSVAFDVQSGGVDGPQSVGVQRLSLDGRPMWNDGQRAVAVQVQHRTASHARAVASGNGDTYVLVEGHDSITGDIDVYAQRVSSEGGFLWGSKGNAIPVFQGPMPEHLGACTNDSNGGLVVIGIESPTYRVSNGTVSDTTIVAERIDLDGKRRWSFGESNHVLAKCDLGDHPMTLIRVQ